MPEYKEPNIDKKFLKPYDANETEKRIYELWEQSGLFNPDVCVAKGHTKGDALPFTIIMPPANANGNLHAGHGLVMTIEDIITRYKRMQGYKALWLPGLDHAGFETQVVYEKKLEKEGRSRFGMDRNDLYKEILDFTKTNSVNIQSQIRDMGASCDWSREQFTLNDNIIKTVYSTFKKLENDGLLYRGKKIVSWCSKHQTSFSNLEILDEERIEPFYYLKYGPFIIATSRPETKFGDKYVVMHPNDTRYNQYEHGQKLELEWINGPITTTVIKDESVDMEFGTGVMTITPNHDQTDFEIAQRYNLDHEQVIDDNGKLLNIAGEFAGLHINKARPLIIEKLQSKGLVDRIDENYKHVVRTCYKCNTIIEPQIKSQWFINMKPLAEKTLEKINADEIKYIPEHYKKVSVTWLENIMDWNISRQIVWGIPIPAQICDSCDTGYVDLDNTIKTCKKCGEETRADVDTFDTWFSSGQWPYATLGFPDNPDFKNYYPTDVMETAGEIIFFWVSRMIMLGLYVTGELPFKTVYLHGLVLDAKGKKMSKSKGNVISPLDLTAKYGTDAFRIGLIVGNTPGTSLALSEDKIRAYKNFANKLWNITRFVLSSTEDIKIDYDFINYSGSDKNLIKERDELINELTKEMDEFKFYIAAEKTYHYIWDTYASTILEESKKIFEDNNDENKISRQQFLLHTLEKILIILHPFMPFVTEEIWQTWKNDNSILMVQKWPQNK